MEFYEWWNDKREKYAKDYAMLGAFAIQKIALCAWEAGQDALRATSQPVIEADAKKPWPCPDCRGTCYHHVKNTRTA